MTKDSYCLYITRLPPSYVPPNFNEILQELLLMCQPFAFCNALKAAMFTQGGTHAWELSGKQAIVYMGNF